MKCSLGISNFLNDVSILYQSYCFPLFLCIEHRGRLSYLSLLFFGTLPSARCIFPFLLCLLLLFSTICKASSDNHFAFLHFFFLGIVLTTTSCNSVMNLHPSFFRHRNLETTKWPGFPKKEAKIIL